MNFKGNHAKFINETLDQCSEIFGVTIDQILNGREIRKSTYPRMSCCVILFQHTDFTMNDVAKVFDKTQASISMTLKKYTEISEDEFFENDVVLKDFMKKHLELEQRIIAYKQSLVN